MPTVYTLAATPPARVAAQLPNVIGRGVAYPLRRTETGGLALVEGDDLLQSEIANVLDIDIGEGVYALFAQNGLPLGTRVRRYVFEPNDTATRNLLAFEIGRSLDAWVPKARITRVQVAPTLNTTDPTQRRSVGVRIGYEARATGQADSFTVPVATNGGR